MPPLFRADAPLIRTRLLHRRRLFAIAFGCIALAAAATFVGDIVLGPDPAASSSQLEQEDGSRLMPDDLQDGTTSPENAPTSPTASQDLIERASSTPSVVLGLGADVVRSSSQSSSRGTASPSDRDSSRSGCSGGESSSSPCPGARPTPSRSAETRPSESPEESTSPSPEGSPSP